MKKYNVAILGATGAVGTEFLKLIEERNFPFNKLRLLASKRSAGKVLKVCGKDYTVEEATKDSFKGIDIALFAGGSISKEFAPYAVQAGAVVIDNSSAFRMDPDVPLIVPEVNPEAILGHKGIIANPNCSTIIMCMALKPLYDLAKIKRVVVSTYQAVSGAGKEGIEELERQVGEYVAGKPMTAELLPTGSMPKHYPIAFNLIPQIDIFLEDLYTKEELKMVNETQKIFNDKNFKVSATCVRVPVYRSHSESVNIEFEHDLDLAEMRKALAAFPGVQVLDDTVKQEYPMPLYTSEKNDCFVGRLRRDDTRPNTFNLWVVGDQIRKGAALNTLQIAEVMIKNQWI
ncbi:MAG: aspartate-semialdehyde dehydrogenase [Phascolarctobacterium sp.]|nr:aspartate-semialdehyde dehydrogenase [Phascolarctobacterium sp.]